MRDSLMAIRKRFTGLYRNPYLSLGIARTVHGYLIVENLITCGLKPFIGLVMAETNEQLEETRLHCSKNPYWYYEKSMDPPESQSGDMRYYMPMLYKKYNIPYVFIKDMNNSCLIELIRVCRIKLAILAEAPILKGAILGAFPNGIMNFHAADLPAYRGSYATYWNLYNDDPLYVTAHFVNRSIDMGSIIKKEKVHIQKGDSLPDVDTKCIATMADMAVDLVKAGKKEKLDSTLQEPWQGTTYRGAMPQDIQDELSVRFSESVYSHYEL